VPRQAPYVAALKQAGLRLTPQRLAVCDALAGNRTHPTAQALYEQVRRQYASVSRATVYNTLQALVATGLVQEIGTAGDGSLHYDADPTPHVNLVCTRCHRVDDFADAPLGAVARSVARGSGYDVRGARVVYYGLCPRCRQGINYERRKTDDGRRTANGRRWRSAGARSQKAAGGKQ
jgi:Fur family peroxide stress response transcriptional regulator